LGQLQHLDERDMFAGRCSHIGLLCTSTASTPAVGLPNLSRQQSIVHMNFAEFFFHALR
jgi:hypothetical protein